MGLYQSFPYSSAILNIVKNNGVGSTIKRYRKLRKTTLRELARSIDVSPATVSAIENGKTGVTLERLYNIAESLGVTVIEILGDGGNPAKPVPDRVREADPEETTDWRIFSPLSIDSILAASVQLFVAKGYHGATMRSIAKLANISVPGIYHHYPSKQDLLLEILELTMMDLLWRVGRARDEEADPLMRIARYVEALALFHMCRKNLAFIGASEMRSLNAANYRKIAELRDRVQRLLDDEIAEAARQGMISTDQLEDAGKAISTMCVSLASWFDPDGPRTAQQIAVEYARLGLSLLGAGASKASSEPKQG